MQVGATSAAGAEIGSINIAGVRLSVRDGRIEGSTADINAGTVKLADGQAENVKLASPCSWLSLRDVIARALT